ncbi:MAG: hypothetical protein PHE55_06870 [Methylococcaceae bacterium]|nr:hypothetical protein [Methylococcaceae bacterium]
MKNPLDNTIFNRLAPTRKKTGFTRLLSRRFGVTVLFLSVAGAEHEIWIDGVTAATQTTLNQPPPTPTNHPPKLHLKFSGTKHKIAEGDTVTIIATATDPDHNPVTLVATPLPDGASFDPSSGVFTWTPAKGSAEITPSVIITFKATDLPSNGSESLTTYQPVTMTVGVNQTPVFDTIPNPQNAAVGENLMLTVSASDADDDNLSFSISNKLPSGASFKNTGYVNGKWTGQLSWKPKLAQLNQSISLSFLVQDDYNNPAQASQDVKFNVTPQVITNDSIKSVIINQVSWNSTKSSLQAMGRVMFTRKYAIISGLSVTISNANTGAVIDTVNVDNNGNWKLTKSLDSGDVPCNISVVAGGPGGRTALRDVKRAPAGVCKN